MNNLNIDAGSIPDQAGGLCWAPVLPSSDLPTSAEVVLGFLDGEELALWRADDGTAQAWANRCPHRGMRFTLGRVLDGRLSCAYHGWEYQAGDGRCVSIPAHPRTVVPRNICAKTYHVAEAQGMIWVRRHPSASTPPHTATQTILRSLGVRTPLANVSANLELQGWRPLTPHVLRGLVADVDVVAHLSAAGDNLVLMHIGTNEELDAQRSAIAHAALRRLRCELEAGWIAQGASQ